MKRFFITYLILLLSFPTYGQNVGDLDTKNGIRNLKLGASSELYAGKLTAKTPFFTNPNIKEYYYQDSSFTSLFGVPIKDISLSFYKNRLMDIQIGFPNTFSQKQYVLILNGLQSAYGNGQDCTIDNDPTVSQHSGNGWVGQKVRMEFHRYYYTSTNYNGWTGYLSIVEKSIRAQMIKDEL